MVRGDTVQRSRIEKAQETEFTLGWKERLASLDEIGLLLQNAWDKLPPRTERGHLEAEDPSPSITDCTSKGSRCSEGPPLSAQGAQRWHLSEQHTEVQNIVREQVADIEADGGSNLEKALPQTIHYRYPGLPRTHLLSAKYTFCSCLRLWALAVMLGLQTVPSSRLLFKAKCMCALKICI